MRSRIAEFHFAESRQGNLDIAGMPGAQPGQIGGKVWAANAPVLHNHFGLSQQVVNVAGLGVLSGKTPIGLDALARDPTIEKLFQIDEVHQSITNVIVVGREVPLIAATLLHLDRAPLTAVELHEIVVTMFAVHLDDRGALLGDVESSESDTGSLVPGLVLGDSSRIVCAQDVARIWDLSHPFLQFFLGWTCRLEDRYHARC